MIKKLTKENCSKRYKNIGCWNCKDCKKADDLKQSALKELGEK